jgi:hypothetical protein
MGSFLITGKKTIFGPFCFHWLCRPYHGDVRISSVRSAVDRSLHWKPYGFFVLFPSLSDDPLDCAAFATEDNREQLVAQRVINESERREISVAFEAAWSVLLLFHLFSPPTTVLTQRV